MSECKNCGFSLTKEENKHKDGFCNWCFGVEDIDSTEPHSRVVTEAEPCIASILAKEGTE